MKPVLGIKAENDCYLVSLLLWNQTSIIVCFNGIARIAIPLDSLSSETRNIGMFYSVIVKCSQFNIISILCIIICQTFMYFDLM